MKHTYLYPIEGDAEKWLWMVARLDAGDLYGSPPTDAPDSMWLLDVGIGDALGKAREALHELIRDRDRICIGRHYLIPGSQCETAIERGGEASRAVREVTAALWDAPYFHGITWANTMRTLDKAGMTDGRDDWVEVRGFYERHRVTKGNGKRTRVIPVWM